MQPDDDARIEEEQADIARRLDAMREIPPPRGFRESVMRQVERRPSPAAVARGRAPRERFAALWAAAAMLVLGFVLVIGRQKMTDTSATMAPAAPEITVTRSGDLYTIEAVVPQRPERVSIETDPATVDIVGVLDKKDASFRKTQVEFTLRTPSDRAGVIVRPRRGASATAVGVSAGSAEAVRKVVALE